MNNSAIDKKIEEFFFAPNKNSEKYRELYFRNNRADKIIRFSPFYLARRDIYYCFGINPEILKKINTGSNFGPANFVGFWLTYETIATVSNAIKEKREDFLRYYLDIKNNGNIEALRKLRNAIAHCNYGLRNRDRGVLWQFALNPNLKYLIRKDRKSTYQSNNFIINPFIFYNRLELGIAKLKKKLLDRRNKELRDIFNKKIRRKHWVIMY